MDSFLESFATVNSYDIDEIFVRAATERQSRVLQSNRATTRKHFDSRIDPTRMLDQPLWLTFSDIIAVFEESGVDPYNSGCVSEFQFREILCGTASHALTTTMHLHLDLCPWEIGAVCEYFSVSPAHRHSATKGFGGAAAGANGAARDIYYNEFAKTFASATTHLVRNLPGNRGQRTDSAHRGTSSRRDGRIDLTGVVDKFRGQRKDLRVDTSPSRGQALTLGDMQRQRQSWNMTAHHGNGDASVARHQGLTNVQLDRALVERIRGAQSEARATSRTRTAVNDARRLHTSVVRRPPERHYPRSAVMEVSTPIRHNDLAYRSEQEVIEAKMERLHERHRRGDGNFPSERRRKLGLGRTTTRESKSRGRVDRSRKHAPSSNPRGRVLAHPKTSRYGQRKHRHR